VSVDRAGEPFATFFFEQLSYDIAVLSVVLSIEQRSAIELTFTAPRAFRSFSESDYWHYLADYGGRRIVHSTDRGCGVFLSETAPYLLDYRAHARAQEPEATFACLVRTPQECVEVICIEPPTVRALE
jgi:hypothetical protein